MVKKRLGIVLSPKIAARPQLCTVVPLSLTQPAKIMPYHKLIAMPFQLPAFWGQQNRWVKGDMVNAVGFHRVDLLRLGKGADGKRTYQMLPVPDQLMAEVRRCVLHGMGLSKLTKHL